MTPLGLLLAGAGIVLVWAAVQGQGPIDVLRSVIDSEDGGSDG